MKHYVKHCIARQRRLCEKAKIEYGDEHVIRHTFATNCYYKGVNVKVLSKLIGHAEVNVIFYIHVHLYRDGFDDMYAALCQRR